MADPPDLERRRAAFARLSSRLAYLDDRELRTMLRGAGRSYGGWGSSHPTTLDGEAVFVKRVPLTDIEHGRAFSTRNHFRLPTYYNYGVGSAGFGAFRELASHIKTTNWVLEGAIANFPMLLHHRVVARTAREMRATAGAGPSEGYVRHWNNSAAVRNFIAARAGAQHELWLVLEHVPHTMGPWLPDNQSQVGDVVRELCETITFLRENGVVHFDAHFGNVLTDGDTVFLSDFGLVLDSAFHLTATERSFLDRHLHYDYGEALGSVGMTLAEIVGRLDHESLERLSKVIGMDLQSSPPGAVLAAVAGHADDLAREGVLTLHPAFVDALGRYRHVIVYMTSFLRELRANPRKNTRYDDDVLRGLLEDAGVPLVG